MARFFHSRTAAAALLLATGMAAAQTPDYTAGVVTFDELTASQHVASAASNYMGFNWAPGFVTWADAGSSMYTTFQASAGTTLSRADKSAFYFDGADFFLRPGAGTNDIYIFLYDTKGALVYDGFKETYGRNHIVDTDRLQTFGAITGINSAGLASYYSGQVSAVAFGWDGSNTANRNGNANDFGMDNLRFRATAFASPVSPVPEPQSYAMLLAGLGLMGAIARRRRA